MKAATLTTAATFGTLNDDDDMMTFILFIPDD